MAISIEIEAVEIRDFYAKDMTELAHCIHVVLAMVFAQ
jgi:hypothetical protein